MIIASVLIIAGAVPHASAQSNEVLDRFLAQETADLPTTVYLVLDAAGRLPQSAEPELAMETLESLERGRRIANFPESVTFGSFSILLVEAFEIPTGLMYRIFPSRRYAAREIAFRGFVPGVSIPMQELSPFQIMAGIVAAGDFTEALR
jgi:hypothetical protein